MVQKWCRNDAGTIQAVAGMSGEGRLPRRRPAAAHLAAPPSSGSVPSYSCLRAAAYARLRGALASAKAPLVALGQWLFCIVGLTLLVTDAYSGGLLGTTSNGRFVSFMDSISNCCDYRNQMPVGPDPDEQQLLCRRPSRGQLARQHWKVARRSVRGKSRYHLRSAKNGWTTRLYIFGVAFWLKYGSSTATSLILGQTPVVAKGPRHFVSFFLAALMVQTSPGDVFYATLAEPESTGSKPAPSSSGCRLVVALSCALYKLRKFTYITQVSAHYHPACPAPWYTTSSHGCCHAPQMGAGSGWGLPFLLAVLVLEGNSLLRTLENVLSHRGVPLRREPWIGALGWLWGRTCQYP
jgi:hypothetical protein